MAGAGVVLLARHASARLPGKALAALGGRSMLEHCLHRLIAAGAGPVVLATTTRHDDDALARVAAGCGVPVFRGAVDDVLGRTLAAARTFDFDPVLRATGDNPAVDIGGPRRLVSLLAAEGGDYVCEEGLPVGAAVEAVSLDALTRCAEEASAPADREHVTTLITREPSRFRRLPALAPPALRRPDLRFTVDSADDLAYMRRVFARVGHDQPSLVELIQAAQAAAREVA
jgi:spore coat polysaccharide biosynthesis protein SpsF